jgi:hypothetical protein
VGDQATHKRFFIGVARIDRKLDRVNHPAKPFSKPITNLIPCPNRDIRVQQFFVDEAW